MHNVYKLSALSYGVITTFLLFNTPAEAETVNCTPITSLPAVIDTQGVFCLEANLGTDITSGNAISITANNVVLDLNGWKVGGQAAGLGSEARGIFSSANNVTIKNGIVRGFFEGIYLTGRGASVRSVLADQNLSDGIRVEGQGSTVIDNKVVDTGNSTKNSSNWPATGIYVDGSESVVKNNIVSGLTATGNSDEIGIYISSGVYSSILSNTISDAAKPAGGGSSWGILIDGTPSVGVISNTLHNFDVGVDYSGGATGTYARNTAISCDTSYSNGTAGPGNHP